MLVLSRKEGQSIIIDGGRISVTVVEIDRGKIRLGISAPDEVDIDREEVFRAKQTAEHLNKTQPKKEG